MWTISKFNETWASSRVHLHRSYFSSPPPLWIPHCFQLLMGKKHWLGNKKGILNTQRAQSSTFKGPPVTFSSMKRASYKIWKFCFISPALVCRRSRTGAAARPLSVSLKRGLIKVHELSARSSANLALSVFHTSSIHALVNRLRENISCSASSAHAPAVHNILLDSANRSYESAWNACVWCNRRYVIHDNYILLRQLCWLNWFIPSRCLHETRKAHKCFSHL